MSNSILNKLRGELDSDAIHGALHRLRRVQRTCTASLSGETLLFVHGAESPTPEEWSEVVATIAAAVKAGCASFLVVTDGAHVKATDRAKALLALRGSGARLALCLGAPEGGAVLGGLRSAAAGLALALAADGVVVGRFNADYEGLRDACKHCHVSDHFDVIAAVRAFRRGRAA